MLYFLVNKKKQAPWANSFDRLYRASMAELGVKTGVVNNKNREVLLPKLTKSDFLFICHYEDISAKDVISCKAKKLAQVNGTGANLYCPQVDQKQEKKEVEKLLDYNVCFNKRIADTLKAQYPKAKTIIAGFPTVVDTPKEKVKRTRKKIVVGGRVSPDKQFYLATYLLKDLLKEGYEIVFCYNNRNDKRWLLEYDYKKFERIGFKFKKLSRKGFIKELLSSSFYFICSLGDTNSIALSEAIMCGCIPIVPDFKEGIPAYDDYVIDGKYEPFSKADVIRTIKSSSTLNKVDISESDPKYCSQELIKFLNLK